MFFKFINCYFICLALIALHEIITNLKLLFTVKSNFLLQMGNIAVPTILLLCVLLALFAILRKRTWYKMVSIVACIIWLLPIGIPVIAYVSQCDYSWVQIIYFCWFIFHLSIFGYLIIKKNIAINIAIK